MEPIQRLGKKFYTWSDKLQKRYPDDWREHANRRTLEWSSFSASLVALVYLFVIQPPVHFPIDQLVTVPEGSFARHRYRKHCTRTA